MPTASDGSPAPDAGQRATSGPADATPATTSTAGPPLKWRILFAVAAMSTVLAFQLVNGIDDLLGQFTADGAESQTMGALIDHEWQDVDDWTRAATTWEAWSISNCPAALVGSSCPARATVPPLDLARTHLLWDLGWLVPSLAALLASLHLIAHADRPKGAGADGKGTADDQSFPAWLGSGVGTRVFVGAALAAVIADLVENASAFLVVDSIECTTGFCSYGGSDWPVVVSNLATWAKLAGFGVCAVLVVARMIAAVLQRLDWRSVRVSLGYALLALVLVFVLRVEQSQDVIRGLTGWQLVLTVGALLLLLAIVIAALVRALQPRGAPTGIEGSGWTQLWWLLPAGGLALLGWGTDSPGLYAGGGLLAAIAGLSTAFENHLPRARDEETSLAADPVRGERLMFGLTLSLLCVALPAAGIGALTGEVLFLSHGSFTDALTHGGAQMIALVAVGLLTAAAIPCVLDLTRGTVERTQEGLSVWRIWAFSVTIVAVAAMFVDPDQGATSADRLGGVAVVLLFAAGLVSVAGLLREASLALAPPGGDEVKPWRFPALFRALGARGPALTWVLVAWVLVAGQVDQPEYHDVHRGEVVAAPETPVSVESQLDEFVARDDERPVRPMLVVSASGGGIRAAYWTAAVLTCVIERETVAEHDEPIDPCGAPATVDDAAARADGLFVMSGISGGSLGLVAYDAHLEAGFGEDERVAGGDWYDEPLGADFLSPTISRWLFGDLPNVMIGRAGGVDRARALERAWENAWVDAEHPLSGGFLESQLDGGPLLLLNSFSIEDGCRLNVSILSTSGGRGLDQCAQMYGDGTTSMDATTDYLGFAACAAGDEGWQDLPRSTAALLSARFPYVTPSGRLACEEDPDILATYAGDGGYRDTSAASPVLELWPEVDEYVTKHNQVADNGCLVPFFLQIDNGYSQAQGRSVDPQPSELTVPIVGYQHASGGIANAARIAAARRFSGTIVDRAGTEVVADPSVLVPTPVPRFMQLTTQSHPGTKAPLGWVLSEAAQRDLDEQLSALGRDIEQVRAWLDGETLHGGVGRGWTDVGLPPPPSGGEQVSLECVRPGD